MSACSSRPAAPARTRRTGHADYATGSPEPAPRAPWAATGGRSSRRQASAHCSIYEPWRTKLLTRVRTRSSLVQVYTDALTAAVAEAEELVAAAPHIETDADLLEGLQYLAQG